MGYGVNADDSLKEEASQREDSKKEVLRMEIESRSENEEFARVAVAVFMSRMNPTGGRSGLHRPSEPYDGGD